MLFPALPPVAVAAEHLAVFGNGFSAVAPRRDVVGFHLFNLEKVAADGANAVLPFVNLALGVVVEGADAKMGVNNYLTPRYVNVKLVMEF